MSGGRGDMEIYKAMTATRTIIHHFFCNWKNARHSATQSGSRSKIKALCSFPADASLHCEMCCHRMFWILKM